MGTAINYFRSSTVNVYALNDDNGYDKYHVKIIHFIFYVFKSAPYHLVIAIDLFTS